MWAFIRRQTLYFLAGFVIAFVIYLFIRFDANDVLLGIGIAAVAGLAVSVFLGWLETQFDEPPPQT